MHFIQSLVCMEIRRNTNKFIENKESFNLIHRNIKSELIMILSLELKLTSVTSIISIKF